MNWLKKESWSPYVGGVIIGVLSWIAFLAIAPLGASTSYVRTSGMLEKIFAADYVNNLPYFMKEKPVIDWQWMFVIGCLAGAFISAKISGKIANRFVPAMWEERFGSGKLRRWIFAFTGGIILMFGARMTDGCPLGHGVSGTLQLAVSSWITVFFMFLTGIVTARILYRKGGK